MTARRAWFGVVAAVLAGCGPSAFVVAGDDAEVGAIDGGTDALGDLGPAESGVDSTAPESATDEGVDLGVADGGFDAGYDAGFDAGYDAGFDAGYDGGFDAGHDGGFDAGYDAGFDGGAIVGNYVRVANLTNIAGPLTICALGSVNVGSVSAAEVTAYTRAPLTGTVNFTFLIGSTCSGAPPIASGTIEIASGTTTFQTVVIYSPSGSGTNQVTSLVDQSAAPSPSAGSTVRVFNGYPGPSAIDVALNDSALGGWIAGADAIPFGSAAFARVDPTALGAGVGASGAYLTGLPTFLGVVPVGIFKTGTVTTTGTPLFDGRADLSMSRLLTLYVMPAIGDAGSGGQILSCDDTTTPIASSTTTLSSCGVLAP